MPGFLSRVSDYELLFISHGICLQGHIFHFTQIWGILKSNIANFNLEESSTVYLSSKVSDLYLETSDLYFVVLIFSILYI